MPVWNATHLVDGVAIPSSNFPTLLICHQFGFCITIPEIYHQSPLLVESNTPSTMHLLHCFRYSRSLSASIMGVRARVADLYSVCCKARI